MRRLKDTIFDMWEKRVRQQIPEAHALRHPILIDTLPLFYDNIVESIDPEVPRHSALDGTNVAAEHGSERARLTPYDRTALITEYRTFRATIFDVLHEQRIALDHRDLQRINGAIDAGIHEAVDAFSRVHDGFRERFAAALTHDLRGPLAATVTALELILLINDPTRIKTVAAKALVNAQRTSGMIDELLHTMAFHNGQHIQLNLDSADIAEIVKEVQADAIAVHGPRIQVNGGSIVGCWDRESLKRVLENLVANAVKYGRAGTPVTIRTEQLHERLVVAVHNEGRPIAPGEQDAIFEMYHRAGAAHDNDAQGWGIGLPYVRAVAESHGGSISVDSTEALGTTFYFDIPLDGRLGHRIMQPA